jgi:hypothetical protein
VKRALSSRHPLRHPTRRIPAFFHHQLMVLLKTATNGQGRQPARARWLETAAHLPIDLP